MTTMKPEVIRYLHISHMMEENYLKHMGNKLFGKEFKGFVKQTTFIHSKGFMTRKIGPIEGTPAKEWRKLIEKSGLNGFKFKDSESKEGSNQSKTDKNKETPTHETN